jgi:pimeloyl-ACP methyl ester carboxylesterase
LKKSFLCGVLVLASCGAMGANTCPTGAFASAAGGIVVFSPVPTIPAPGLRYLFLDGRRGSTLDSEPIVRCKGSSVEVRERDGPWVSWSRIDLAMTDTAFSSAETRLAGRLIEPASSKAQLPLIVMVHGSERTPALGSPYALMLAAQGVRVFAYDKRGTGASDGEYTQNFELLAEDAARALAHARTLAAGRFDRAGYFGGSQGGWVAPLAAMRAPADFVAVGFGLVVSPIEEDREQMMAEARSARLGAEALEGIDRLSRATATLLKSHFETGYEALDAIRRDPSTRAWAEKIVGEHSGAMLRASDADLRRFGRARFDNLELIWDYDAAAVLQRLDVPILWVLAEQDREAPIERTRELLSSFAADGKPIETWMFPGTDHGMFEFITERDGTRRNTRITDGYLRLLGDWVRGKTPVKYGNGLRLVPQGRSSGSQK